MVLLTQRSAFSIVPTPQIEQTLITGIHAGSYIMLHGPHASGKSTIMYRAKELLKDEFVCLTVSIQGLDCSTIKKFWRNWSEAMQNANKHVQVPLMDSASDFRRFLASQKRTELFGGKKVVLFVDEFDTL
jgi:ABC-type cobalamin/Fe3+-siderophores transport system ATPase subunit